MPFGWQELLILLVIVLVIFGAGKLAGVGGALGRSVKEFRTEAGGDDVAANSSDKSAAVETRTETTPPATTPTAATDTRRG
jgi:sec-independent protein translocase protein TatA